MIPRDDSEHYEAVPVRRAVTPARAMFESTARTAISMVVGAGLTWMAAQAAKQGLNWQPSEASQEVVVGIVWVTLSSLYAAIQRKYVPIQTDVPGAARTDVTAGGKPL